MPGLATEPLQPSVLSLHPEACLLVLLLNTSKPERKQRVMYVLLLSPEGGFFLQPDYGNVRPVGIPHSDSTHFGQYPLDAERGDWGTCSIEEGVTVYMEWYQISVCPEVCGACN